MEISRSSDNENVNKDGGPPLVFLRERDLFGERKPQKVEWLRHEELYNAIAQRIDPSHITGLQRVRTMWRIYVDNLSDKVVLMSDGVQLRGRIIGVLNTNPDRLDGENTTRVCVKNIPLSVDDGLITRTLTLKGLDAISNRRDKLRINGKLTNCCTGDRICIVKTSSLKEPLPKTMQFGQFIGLVLHNGQLTVSPIKPKCSKCLEEGHVFNACPNDWVCKKCNTKDHRQSECDNYTDTLCDTNTTHPNTGDEHEEPVKPVETPINKRASNTRSRSASATRSTVSCSQPTIIRFTENINSSNTSTPNKGREKNVTASSPPTPVNELQKKTQSSDRKTKHAKKK
ncbi:hypothetical protein DPMN_084307 [Dreissena polymorpha]|uniref:CCHC-type domain-containing protein n=1 Tax=Dreissena polymorpha TaxID=45954 RepID=A0A9D3YEM4_DREPO|nr:hypothetical protein DPMN_084307 [Dreissena polymorpha]